MEHKLHIVEKINFGFNAEDVSDVSDIMTERYISEGEYEHLDEDEQCCKNLQMVEHHAGLVKLINGISIIELNDGSIIELSETGLLHTGLFFGMPVIVRKIGKCVRIQGTCTICVIDAHITITNQI